MDDKLLPITIGPELTAEDNMSFIDLTVDKEQLELLLAICRLNGLDILIRNRNKPQ